MFRVGIDKLDYDIEYMYVLYGLYDRLMGIINTNIPIIIQHKENLSVLLD